MRHFFVTLFLLFVYVDMNGCNQITNAAFLHLRGIHTLNMSGCNQITITDAAFVNLSVIYLVN